MKKNLMKDKFMPYLLSLSMLSFVAACGSDDDDDNNPLQNQEQVTYGSYQANLTPINPIIAPDVKGTVDISIKQDADEVNDKDFNVKVAVTGVAPGAHIQNIFLGRECPNESDNLNPNDDAYVDVVEGQRKYGNILIPLDGDLDSQLEGITRWPNASSLGEYVYEEDGDFDDMMKDLLSPDTIETDIIGKLDSQTLDLEGRVVVIHSVTATSNLPSSVASALGLPAYKTLPIACGVIQKTAVAEPEPIPTPEVPLPTEPAPTEPAPSEPTPTEPAPTEPTPSV